MESVSQLEEVLKSAGGAIEVKSPDSASASLSALDSNARASVLPPAQAALQAGSAKTLAESPSETLSSKCAGEDIKREQESLAELKAVIKYFVSFLFQMLIYLKYKCQRSNPSFMHLCPNWSKYAK